MRRFEISIKNIYDSSKLNDKEKKSQNKIIYFYLKYST